MKDVVLITGFGPFLNHDVNASWATIQELIKLNVEEDLCIKLVTQEIAVSYHDVDVIVPELCSKYKPKLVIHCGVSSLATQITLEKQAHKIGYKKLDVCQKTPLLNCCTVGDTDVMECSFNLDFISKEINSLNLPVNTCVSEDAGRYLCEYIYYTSLAQGLPVVFIHVPPIGEIYNERSMAECIKRIMNLLLESLKKKDEIINE